MRIVVAIDARHAAINGSHSVARIVVGAPVTQMTRQEGAFRARGVCQTTSGIGFVACVLFLFLTVARGTKGAAVVAANCVASTVVGTPVARMERVAGFARFRLGARLARQRRQR